MAARESSLNNLNINSQEQDQTGPLWVGVLPEEVQTAQTVYIKMSGQRYTGVFQGYTFITSTSGEQVKVVMFMSIVLLLQYSTITTVHV